MTCLDAWERFLHDEPVPPLIHAALVHSQFEAIHPFLDGNGRVGRLLITLQLVGRNIIPSPLLYLSAYFEATRDEYYARLLGVTERGEWDEWLNYFLRGVVMQAEDAVDHIQRIDDLFTRWRHELATGRSRFPERVLDLFVENPFWTVSSLASRLDVAYTTAQRSRHGHQRHHVPHAGASPSLPPAPHRLVVDVETADDLRPRQARLLLEPLQPLREVVGDLVGHSAVVCPLSRHRAGPSAGLSDPHLRERPVRAAMGTARWREARDAAASAAPE